MRFGADDKEQKHEKPNPGRLTSRGTGGNLIVSRETEVSEPTFYGKEVLWKELPGPSRPRSRLESMRGAYPGVPDPTVSRDLHREVPLYSPSGPVYRVYYLQRVPTRSERRCDPVVHSSVTTTKPWFRLEPIEETKLEGDSGVDGGMVLGCRRIISRGGRSRVRGEPFVSRGRVYV